MRIPQNVSRGNRDGNTLRKIMFTVKVKEPSESAGSHEAQGCINILYNLSEIYWYQPFILALKISVALYALMHVKPLKFSITTVQSLFAPNEINNKNYIETFYFATLQANIIQGAS